MAWELEPESCAAAGAVLETDAAVHHLDQALADGEAEAGAALLPRGGRIGLVEAAEHARAECLRNARAAVVHADAQGGAVVLRRDLDDLALGREFRRVGEQVRHYLQQALAVGVDFARGELAARLETHLEAVAETLVEEH